MCTTTNRATWATRAAPASSYTVHARTCVRHSAQRLQLQKCISSCNMTTTHLHQAHVTSRQRIAHAQARAPTRANGRHTVGHNAAPHDRNRTQCNLTQQHQQLHVQHQQHLQQQQHLRHHRHQHVRAHARAHTHVRRRPTRRRSPRTAQARRARTDTRCTALARPKVQRRRCHFLLRMKLGRIRAAKRSVRCFEIQAARALSRNGTTAAPPAPVSRNNAAWTPRPRPTSIARIPHVGWSLGPQAHPTHCRLRHAAGYQAHPVTSARPRRRRRAGASPTPAERIYRRPYRLPRRPPSSAAVIYMYYLALRFYLLVVYYLCQSSDPSLSEPRPPPSVPPWRCAHPPAAPAPCPPRAPARST